jgi:hypothetical protein
LATSEHMDEPLFAFKVPKLFTFMSLHYEYRLKLDLGSTESTGLEGRVYGSQSKGQLRELHRRPRQGLRGCRRGETCLCPGCQNLWLMPRPKACHVLLAGGKVSIYTFPRALAWRFFLGGAVEDRNSPCTVSVYTMARVCTQLLLLLDCE